MTAHHGILLVDKPSGCTSHDVVAWARRVFEQREVGHAGTLDPMATGLLVVLLGEGTKLSNYLTAESKAYATTIRFGATTTSLDADGEITDRVDAASPSEEAIRNSVREMIGPMEQIPPVVSAIKQGGVALHERVRRGEIVEPSARSVVLESADVIAVRENECDLEIACSKGFYVRSLARDLASRLNTLGYLTALRRTRSGVFDLRAAIDGVALRAAAKGGADRAEIRSRLRPIERGLRPLIDLDVGEEDALQLSQGKVVAIADAPDGALMVFPRGVDKPICIATGSAGTVKVARGFYWGPAATGQ